MTPRRTGAILVVALVFYSIANPGHGPRRPEDRIENIVLACCLIVGVALMLPVWNKRK